MWGTGSVDLMLCCRLSRSCIILLCHVRHATPRRSKGSEQVLLLPTTDVSVLEDRSKEEQGRDAQCRTIHRLGPTKRLYAVGRPAAWRDLKHAKEWFVNCATKPTPVCVRIGVLAKRKHDQVSNAPLRHCGVDGSIGKHRSA